jgi:hypothetical protein
MVVEVFKDNCAMEVYKRAIENGRMLPDGLTYIDSWVETNFSKCYQLMETHDVSLFKKWTAHWQDLIDFDIIPIITSKEAFEFMKHQII